MRWEQDGSLLGLPFYQVQKALATYLERWLWGTDLDVLPPLALKPDLWKRLALLTFAISLMEPTAGAEHLKHQGRNKRQSCSVSTSYTKDTELSTALRCSAELPPTPHQQMWEYMEIFMMYFSLAEVTPALGVFLKAFVNHLQNWDSNNYLKCQLEQAVLELWISLRAHRKHWSGQCQWKLSSAGPHEASSAFSIQQQLTSWA